LRKLDARAHQLTKPSQRLGPKSPAAADFAARLALARETAPEGGGQPSLFRLLAETQIVMEPLRKLRGPIDVQPSKNPRKVMVLPGFATHPVRMRYMARQLRRADHTVHHWGLGFNFGPTPENLEALENRIIDLHRRHGEKLVLLGWSLGGLFARELARRQPDAVAQVITMGSPFSGNPRANNAWRIYQFVTGHSVENPPIAGDMAAKPPVPTTAIWSPRDGIVSPRSACGKSGERDRAVALRCTHIGFPYCEESIQAVLRELED